MWDPVGAIPCGCPDMTGYPQGAIPCGCPDMTGYPQGAPLQIDKLINSHS